MYRTLFILLISFISLSCERNAIDRATYGEWVEGERENLIQSAQVGELQYKMTLKPSELLLMQWLEDEKLSQDSVNVLRKEFEAMIYLTFQMKMEDNSSVISADETEENASIRINHFISNMQSDFSMICGTDTIPCSLYHYERDYGIDPYETFSIAFQRPSKFQEDEIHIWYRDQVMGTGPVRFTYFTDQLLNQPQVQF